jgi:hypothetical protein
MRCADPIRDSRIAGVVIVSETEVSIFSKILHVRFVWTKRRLGEINSGSPSRGFHLRPAERGYDVTSRRGRQVASDEQSEDRSLAFVPRLRDCGAGSKSQRIERSTNTVGGCLTFFKIGSATWSHPNRSGLDCYT